MAAALFCALAASLALFVAPAAAEAPESAPIRNLGEGGFSFPDISGPEAPEEYPFRVILGEELFLEQVSETEVAAFYPGHLQSFVLDAEDAHDATGATVPTTVTLEEGDIVTLTVHHRAGNPSADGLPFLYPIVSGPGWRGGFFTGIVEMNNPQAPMTAPPASSPAPAPMCTVPSLRGFGLRAAKGKLRGGYCRVGAIYLAAGATLGKGKVVKQFRAAGTELAAGAPVAVKLAGR